MIGIESCIRYKGEVVIVMPYQKHSDFMVSNPNFSKLVKNSVAEACNEWRCPSPDSTSAPKKRRGDGEPLASLRSNRPTRESNPRPIAMLAVC